MNNIDAAIDRIKILECPTGEIENRVAGILENYGVAERSKVNISRVKNLDQDQAQAYNVKFQGEDSSIVVLAKSGLDDYVAKVVDAYKK
ncbi:hypothetical protein [Ruminiclostridium papyrosolvens]|uniref:Uncharacterized protein n=1 Tax=Ruminiclostridium papyrosolvens C7 TaxID=1330534 RepID=U4R2R5_9FIRM|nr:hypothetical protein [Ruminiclostridium papyrosolvens]EPR12797.1 hypothetical protein L323_06940 [Ruminiclostridium papyrosolvens C7]